MSPLCWGQRSHDKDEEGVWGVGCGTVFDQHPSSPSVCRRLSLAWISFCILLQAFDSRGVRFSMALRGQQGCWEYADLCLAEWEKQVHVKSSLARPVLRVCVCVYTCFCTNVYLCLCVSTRSQNLRQGAASPGTATFVWFAWMPWRLSARLKKNGGKTKGRGYVPEWCAACPHNSWTLLKRRLWSYALGRIKNA